MGKPDIKKDGENTIRKIFFSKSFLNPRVTCLSGGSFK